MNKQQANPIISKAIFTAFPILYFALLIPSNPSANNLCTIILIFIAYLTLGYLHYLLRKKSKDKWIDWGLPIVMTALIFILLFYIPELLGSYLTILRESMLGKWVNGCPILQENIAVIFILTAVLMLGIKVTDLVDSYIEYSSQKDLKPKE